MKCVKCGTDNNLQERKANQGRCKNCNHLFAFEPTKMASSTKFTDPFFANIIDNISAQGTLYFTPKQLLYFLDRRLKRKATVNIVSFIFIYIFLSLWGAGFLGGILASFIGPIAIPIVLVVGNILFILSLWGQSNTKRASPQSRKINATKLQILGVLLVIFGVWYGLTPDFAGPYWMAILLGLATVWLGFSQKRRVAQMPESFLISANQLQDWLQKWTEANGIIEPLLPEVSKKTRSLPPPNTLPADVTAYSFDRVVVCDTVAIAQLLIANNFHFENNCAILTLSGYPDAIFDTTMEMLRRNPNLTVFAFHNCNPKGMELAHQLRTHPQWFPDPTIDVIDVGLSPRQVLSMRRMLFVQQLPQSGRMAQNLDPTIRQSLSPEELQWLEAGNFVELESFTPQRLIQILNRSIARGRYIGEADGVPADDNSWILLGGDDGGFYTSDSFG